MYVYLFYNKDEELLYIGKTRDIKKRMYQHRTDSKINKWKKEIETIKYCYFDNECDMHIYEVWLINKMNPIHNKEFSEYGFTNINLDIPEFEVYYEGKFDHRLKMEATVELNFDKELLKRNLLIYEVPSSKTYQNRKIYEGLKRKTATKDNLLLVRNDLYNYYRHISKSTSNDFLWTTFPEWKKDLVSSGVNKNFTYMHDLKTNSKNVKTLAFIGDLSDQFRMYGNLNHQNNSILNILLSFISLSNIENEEVMLYLPSKNMRNLLEQYLND